MKTSQARPLNEYSRQTREQRASRSVQVGSGPAIRYAVALSAYCQRVLPLSTNCYQALLLS